MRYFELGPDDAVTIQTPAGPVTVRATKRPHRLQARVKVETPSGVKASRADAAEVTPPRPLSGADHTPIKLSARRTGTRRAAP